MAATFDDDHLEVQPLVPIVPSTIASHHLNVTVIVQDEDRTGPASELRAAGKAVMDTANYSDNFVLYDMIEKSNATHLYYPALEAITVCSGLEGQCYLNNEICNLKILFHSYDGECHSISLPMRINRKTDIDMFFSRDTVNKYDFWTLIPLAFGISPELSAENKTKSDARRRQFERKEALDKLDPLFQHKYTRRMIALGTEPDTAVVESITPHYDKLKYPGGKPPSKKRDKIVSVDEIDSQKVDAFGAYFSNNKDLHRVEDDAQAFLQQSVFAGTETQVHRLKDLVMEYRDIFSDILVERVADLTPLRFNVEEPLWDTPRNRTRVDPSQSRTTSR